LWTKQDKRSYSFRLPAEIKKAAAFACGLARKKKDVYFGVTPSKTAYSGTSGRGKAEDAAALVAFWADVDLGSGGHSSQSKNPPDIATVKELLRGIPAPSISIHSGGGLHLYWLLEEPFPITDEASRKEASAMVEGWQNVLREKFKIQGYTLDATADLARLLRVPGTFNLKDPSAPKPVISVPDFNTQEEK
jgi:putative DNA primase/helicase